MGLEMLMHMFGGLGTGSPAIPNRSNVPPEELYATQLSQLQEMGFSDAPENIRALVATPGNVHAAVERLLGNYDYCYYSVQHDILSVGDRWNWFGPDSGVFQILLHDKYRL